MKETVSRTTFNPFFLTLACYSCAARCGSGCATNPLEFGTTSVKSAGFQPAGEASSTTPPKDAGLQTHNRQPQFEPGCHGHA